MASSQMTLARQCVPHSTTAARTAKRLLQKKSNNISFAWMKHGMGRLTATADHHRSTKLTQVSHKAPMRWLPLNNSRVEQAGAAIAAMSNYGAGLLPGDVNQVEVQVHAKARLGILTQGSNRIYKQKQQVNVPAKSTLQARVEPEGFLVVAPDPTVPFAQSSFHQQQEFVVHPTSSLIAIDWISSGRFANGERWQAHKICTETKLKLLMDDKHDHSLLVWDATTLQQQAAVNFGFDLGQQSFNAYASMLLYGTESLPVVEQLQELQHQLASSHTRLRGTTLHDNNHHDLGATGRVLLGVNQLQVESGPVYMARWAASSNEDLYRMLHHSLQPLAPLFGLEFYRDRIRATSSGDPTNNKNGRHSTNGAAAAAAVSVSSIEIPKQQTTSTASSWNAYMLADSALPTGSFAHSAGLEAASQLGLLKDNHKTEPSDNNQEASEQNVQRFVEASTRSTLQQATPWILSGHDIASRLLEEDPGSIEVFVREWGQLDRHVHAVLVCSAPACRASLDQGRNLLRVALPWLQEGGGSEAKRISLLLETIQDRIKTSPRSTTSGHMAPFFGILASALQLKAVDACHLLGYCCTRDIVSAAVRLNLIGPLQSVAMLSKAQESAQVGIELGLPRDADEKKDNNLNEDNLLWESAVAGGCAPVLDAIHPCHDLLAVRLFRT